MDVYSRKMFSIGKMGLQVRAARGSAYNRSSSAHANAAAADKRALAPVEAGALGPPGFELLMAPVEIIPAEQEFWVVTTENVVDAATAVALRVTPLTTMVCAPAACPFPEYVTSK